MPGTFAVAKQSSLFEQGLSAGRTIDIEITGPDLHEVGRLGGQILGQVKQMMPEGPGPSDPQSRPVDSGDAHPSEAAAGGRDGSQQCGLGFRRRMH